VTIEDLLNLDSDPSKWIKYSDLEKVPEDFKFSFDLKNQDFIDWVKTKRPLWTWLYPAFCHTVMNRDEYMDLIQNGGIMEVDDIVGKAYHPCMREKQTKMYMKILHFFRIDIQNLWDIYNETEVF
jgi:hypothetical protein